MADKRKRVGEPERRQTRHSESKDTRRDSSSSHAQPWKRLWVKMQGFPTWPAVVVDPSHPDVPEDLRDPARWSTRPQCVIQWFGTGEFSRATIDPKITIDFDGGDSAIAEGVREEFAKKKTNIRGHGLEEWEEAVRSCESYVSGTIPRLFTSPRKSASSPAAARGRKRRADGGSSSSGEEESETEESAHEEKPKPKPAATNASKRPRADGVSSSAKAAATRAYNAGSALFPKLRTLLNSLEGEFRKASGGPLLSADDARAALEEERRLRADAEESITLLAVKMTRACEAEVAARGEARRLRRLLRSALERLAAATGAAPAQLEGWAEAQEPPAAGDPCPESRLLFPSEERAAQEPTL
eukprot:tig00000863_g4994.t1